MGFNSGFKGLKRGIDWTMEKTKQHNVDSYKLYILYISSTSSINMAIKQDDRKCPQSSILRVSSRNHSNAETVQP